jgi:broad specificity phosphatase PhoE
MRYVEVRRHTDNDGDQLTPEGIAAAEEIGRSQLHTPYAVFVSSGAGRATQMLEILRAAAGQPDVPIVAEPGLRSAVEDRWRESAKAAGDSDIEAIRTVDPDLVEKETQQLGAALRRVAQHVPDGGRAMVIGHSPTNEAAVMGVSGHHVPPMGKGQGVLLAEDNGKYAVIEPLH